MNSREAYAELKNLPSFQSLDMKPLPENIVNELYAHDLITRLSRPNKEGKIRCKRSELGEQILQDPFSLKWDPDRKPLIDLYGSDYTV